MRSASTRRTSRRAGRGRRRRPAGRSRAPTVVAARCQSVDRCDQPSTGPRSWSSTSWSTSSPVPSSSARAAWRSSTVVARAAAATALARGRELGQSDGRTRRRRPPRGASAHSSWLGDVDRPTRQGPRGRCRRARRGRPPSRSRPRRCRWPRRRSRRSRRRPRTGGDIGVVARGRARRPGVAQAEAGGELVQRRSSRSASVSSRRLGLLDGGLGRDRRLGHRAGIEAGLDHGDRAAGGRWRRSLRPSSIRSLTARLRQLAEVHELAQRGRPCPAADEAPAATGSIFDGDVARGSSGARVTVARARAPPARCHATRSSRPRRRLDEALDVDRLGVVEAVDGRRRRTGSRRRRSAAARRRARRGRRRARRCSRRRRGRGRRARPAHPRPGCRRG